MRAKRVVREAGAGLAAGGAGPGWAGEAAAGAGVASAVPITRIAMPCETLSPTFTLTSCTTPSASAGTSIDAFSLSSVMSESFFLTRSPGLTKTSITGTSLKSPISGTRTSTVPPAAAAGAVTAAGTAADGWGDAAGCATASVLSTRSGDPCETLSPTFTLTSCTTPSASAGTSIEAFSLSSVTSESFFLTRSPFLTRTSITGTSLKSPMSGTRTSISLISPFYTVIGLALLGSMPYFATAFATVAAGTVPSSASARNAAIVTKCRSTSKNSRSLRRKSLRP